MAAVVGLVSVILGFLAGSSTAVRARIGLADDRLGLGSPVVVASVEETSTQEFRLRVYNPGDSDVEVDLVEVGGWVPQASTSARIAAGLWGFVRFSAPSDCRFPADPRVILLRVRTKIGDFDQTVPTPVGVTKLTEHHQALCAETAPVTAEQLAGVWLLEEVHGPEKDLADTHMMRFTADGTFAVDPDGRLFGDDIALWGSYRIERSFVTWTPAGGHWECSADEKATWRASIATDPARPGGLRPHQRLRLALMPGSSCPDGAGQVWIARRVLDDVRLPGPPPHDTPAAG